MANKKKMFTYILKDKELDIYKIGKTTDPSVRFKNLCTRGEVYPIAIIDEDVEKALHTMYNDNRIGTNAKATSGVTEWFKRGGKFDELLEKIDDGEEVPYITPHAMLKDMEERGNFTILGPGAMWEFDNIISGRHALGTAFLQNIGALLGKPFNYTVAPGYEDDIELYTFKVSLTDSFAKMLATTYKIALADKTTLGSLKTMKGDGTVCLCSTKIKGFTFYFIINKVL